MKIKINRFFLIKFLIVLLVINYMVITILLKDNFVCKYIRDIILLTLFILSMYKQPLKRSEFGWILFLILLIFTFIRSTDYALALVSIRKYYFPILLLFVVKRYDFCVEYKYVKFLNFICYFFAFISFLGIFQAWILGDQFLKKIGYAVSYNYGYGREMLTNSFYFGGLGIQRVVATLSNSNVCGLILGSTLIVLICFYPFIKLKFKKFLIFIILIAYILTFSRSNFLSLFVVCIFLMYPYIPNKKILIVISIFVLMFIFIIGIYEGNNGLIFKLWTWVVSSINMTDSSVAGRFSIWSTAYAEVLKHPLGLGFGHVGSIAINANSDYILNCENSYLAIAIDNGIFALLIFIYNYLSLLHNFRKDILSKDLLICNRINICGKCLIIYLLIIMFFSNHIYDMEAISIVFIYIGFCISLKYHIKKNKMEDL